MNWLKNIFVISIFNFLVIVGIVNFFPVAQASKQIDSLDVVPAISTAPTVVISPKIKQVSPTNIVDPLAGKCIVYISGVRLDVTDFRNRHGGGDIFQCGTDMTDIFKGQHPGSYLNKMARYKI